MYIIIIIKLDYKSHDFIDKNKENEDNRCNYQLLLTLENNQYLSAVEVIFRIMRCMNRFRITEFSHNDVEKYIYSKWYNDIYDKCFGDLNEYIKNCKYIDLSKDFNSTLNIYAVSSIELANLIRKERTIVAECIYTFINIYIYIIDIHNYNKTNTNDKIYSFENGQEFYSKYNDEIVKTLDNNELPYLSGLEFLISNSISSLSRDGSDEQIFVNNNILRWSDNFYENCLGDLRDYLDITPFFDIYYYKNLRLFPFKFSNFKKAVIDERKKMKFEMDKIDNTNFTFSQANFNEFERILVRSIQEIKDTTSPGALEIIITRV